MLLFWTSLLSHIVVLSPPPSQILICHNVEHFSSFSCHCPRHASNFLDVVIPHVEHFSSFSCHCPRPTSNFLDVIVPHAEHSSSFSCCYCLPPLSQIITSSFPMLNTLSKLLLGDRMAHWIRLAWTNLTQAAVSLFNSEAQTYLQATFNRRNIMIQSSKLFGKDLRAHFSM